MDKWTSPDHEHQTFSTPSSLHFLEVLLQETEIAPGDNIALLGLGAQWPSPPAVDSG
jgi:3-oxoacyl-[acyl-carrier-protein] synthase III